MHKKNEHVPFFSSLCCAYVAFVLSENEDEISTSISTRQSTENFVDTALAAYVFMLMF